MLPLTLIVTDSRGKNFAEFERNQDGRLHRGYDTEYLSIPGAKISDLAYPILAKLSDFRANYDVFIVKIAAGINNFTKKVYNSRGESEIILANVPATSGFRLLTQLKYQIKDEYPRSVVSYCTIPPCKLGSTAKACYKMW